VSTVGRAITGALGAAALTVACIAFVRSIDVDRLRAPLVAELRAATGRDIAAEGPLALSFWPLPHFVLSDVAVANAPWGTRAAFARIERIDAAIALTPLLEGKLRIKRLRLVRPDLWLETDPFGKVNWVLTGGPLPALQADAPPPGAGAILGALAIDRIDIDGGRLSYRDGATGDVTVLTVGAASVAGDGHDVPFELTFAGGWNALPIKLRGAVGPYRAAASDAGKATAVRLALDAAGVALSVDGTVGALDGGPGADLRIAGKAAALDGVGAMLGLSLPRAAPVSLDADLRYRGSRLALSNVRLAVDGQAARGTASLDFSGARPVLAADLRAENIDLTPLAAGAGLIDTLAASGILSALDGTADLEADTVRLGPLVLREASAHVALDAGILRADPVRAETAAGAVAGSIRLDGEAVPARLALAFKAPKLAAGPALQQFGTVKAFGGVVSLAADLTTVAGPPDKMLAGLAGEALIAMGEGRLTLESQPGPFDAPGAGLGGLVGLIAADGRQDVALECLAGRVTVQAGVAAADGFVLVSEDARVRGEGTADFNTGGLALRFAAEATGGALRVDRPLSVRGTLAAPVLALEPEAARAAPWSDTALYPIRRFFAGLGTGATGNACLRGLPPVPKKRALPAGNPIAQRPAPEVQEAVVRPSPKPAGTGGQAE
jgi:uncharacterized protein involved in outer membrane biogenesis